MPIFILKIFHRCHHGKIMQNLCHTVESLRRFPTVVFVWIMAVHEKSPGHRLEH